MFKINRGFTLVEIAVVLAIAGIALSLALPSWQGVTDRHRLTSETEQVSALLVTAQSEAIKRNRAVSISFTRNAATDWCVGAVLGDTGCDCTVTDAGDGDFCRIDEAPHRTTAAFLNDLSLVSASDQQPPGGDARVVFDPVRGILDPPGDMLQFDFESHSGNYRLRVRIGPTGMLRLCTPAGYEKMGAYPECAA